MRHFAGLEIRHDDREHANAAEIFRVTNSLKVPLEGTRAVDSTGGHVMMAKACLQSSVGRYNSSEKEPSSQSQQSDRDPDPTDYGTSLGPGQLRLAMLLQCSVKQQYWRKHALNLKALIFHDVCKKVLPRPAHIYRHAVLHNEGSLWQHRCWEKTSFRNRT